MTEEGNLGEGREDGDRDDRPAEEETRFACRGGGRGQTAVRENEGAMPDSRLSRGLGARQSLVHGAIWATLSLIMPGRFQFRSQSDMDPPLQPRAQYVKLKIARSGVYCGPRGAGSRLSSLRLTLRPPMTTPMPYMSPEVASGTASKARRVT